METLKKDIFKKLMSKAVCDSQDSINEVTFISKYNKWGIEFYIDEDDVFGYVNLGFNGSNGWVEYGATEEQEKEMETYIDNHIKDLILEQKQEELEDRSEAVHMNSLLNSWGE
jgi:hypothetical protein